jgi:hypothetical protein
VPDDSEQPPPSTPTSGPTDHLDSVDYWRGGYMDAVAVGQEYVDRMHAAEKIIRAGIEAFRLTREYVTPEMLPAQPGWSWWDWTTAATSFLPASAERFPPGEGAGSARS